MFKHKEHKKRGTFLAFTIFRLLLSLTIFAALLGGAYTAFEHFSGVDPLKFNPTAVISEGKNLFIASFLEKLPSKPNFLIQQLKKDQPIPISNISKPSVNSHKNITFKFMLIADLHNENNYLKKALQQAKKDYDPKFVIGLGDYSEVGTGNELMEAKKVLDEAGIRYFLTPGDHDLWDARDKQEPADDTFVKIFGPPYQSFSYLNARFLIIYNADNYQGLSKEQLKWLSDELNLIKSEQNTEVLLAFMHEPLYHPSSDHFMGKTTPALKQQASSLIKTLKEAGVKEVFAGDVHFFTRYSEPESNLNMVTIGAITSQRNVQTPRFGIVTVYDDGNFDVEDVEIK